MKFSDLCRTGIHSVKKIQAGMFVNPIVEYRCEYCGKDMTSLVANYYKNVWMFLYLRSNPQTREKYFAKKLFF